MTLGELKSLIEAAIESVIADDKTEEQALALEVVVRATACGIDDGSDLDYCGTPAGVRVEFAHDEEDTPYLAIDCVDESELLAEEEE